MVAHGVLPAEVRYVVGIDVAKHAHVVCALEAPGGALWQKPFAIEASASGYVALCEQLAGWGACAAILVGLEAPGPLWEPLYEAVTQAGYHVLLRESASDGDLGREPGSARQDRWDRRADHCAWGVRWPGAGEYPADGKHPSFAYPHAGTARPRPDTHCSTPTPPR